MQKMQLVACTVVLFMSTLCLVSGQMQTVYEWEYIDYIWPSSKAKNKAIESGEYNRTMVIPQDVDRDKDGRIFLSFLGNNGTPATLGVVSSINDPMGPLINPYPHWSWFKSGSCDSLINLYRIWIDTCNRLWVVDTGFKQGQPSECPPKLVVFDLNTDTLISTINIPDNIARDKNNLTLLATPIVDSEGPFCRNTQVYIADVYGNGLVVLSGKNGYRLESSAFKPSSDPKARNFTTGSDHLDFNFGLVGLAMSPRLFPNEPKYLYFHPLTSLDLFSMSSTDLQNYFDGKVLKYEKVANIFPSQIVTMAFSSQGTMFFGLTKEIAVGCWNEYRPLTKRNLRIVAQDDERLRYLTGVKVIKPSKAHPKEELLVLSNRLLAFISGSLQNEKIKYRVLKASVQSLVQNTVCDLPKNVKEALHRRG